MAAGGWDGTTRETRLLPSLLTQIHRCPGTIRPPPHRMGAKGAAATSEAHWAQEEAEQWAAAEPEVESWESQAAVREIAGPR